MVLSLNWRKRSALPSTVTTTGVVVGRLEPVKEIHEFADEKALVLLADGAAFTTSFAGAFVGFVFDAAGEDFLEQELDSGAVGLGLVLICVWSATAVDKSGVEVVACWRGGSGSDEFSSGVVAIVDGPCFSCYWSWCPAVSVVPPKS